MFRRMVLHEATLWSDSCPPGYRRISSGIGECSCGSTVSGGLMVWCLCGTRPTVIRKGCRQGLNGPGVPASVSLLRVATYSAERDPTGVPFSVLKHRRFVHRVLDSARQVRETGTAVCDAST